MLKKMTQILACAALTLGIVGPAALSAVQAVGAEEAVTPYAMTEQVVDTYKSFSGGNFSVGRYDETYKTIRFNKTYYQTGPKQIAYYSGSYKGKPGHVSVWQYGYNCY